AAVEAGHQPEFELTVDVDAALAAADVVVTATSSTLELVRPENVKAGAIVCDMSRPPNVAARMQAERPDVLVIDGGVVEVPGRPYMGFNFGFERGLAYACMSETMMLALEQHYEHTSLGSELPLATLEMMRNLAAKHGFRLAWLRSFDRPLSEADWQRVQKARAEALGLHPRAAGGGGPRQGARGEARRTRGTQSPGAHAAGTPPLRAPGPASGPLGLWARTSEIGKEGGLLQQASRGRAGRI